MSDSTIAVMTGLLAGPFGGLGVAVFQWFTSRWQHRLEEDELSLEIWQLSELVRDSVDSVRHRLPGAEYAY
jgi:hypothetical protein